MKDFDYYSPHSLEEALSLLDSRQGAKVLAGGTDLMVQMKERRATPSVVIDVKGVPELNRFYLTEKGTLFIGAAVPLAKIVAHPEVRKFSPMLFEACSLVGSWQLRNRATMGGNVCNAAPSADTAPPLITLSAQAIVAGINGSRSVPMAEFFTAPGTTVLTEKEVLVGIEIPPPHGPCGDSYMRHIPRQEMDIAVAGVAALLLFDGENVCREARIALGAVAPTPMRSLQAESILSGRPLTEGILEEAARRASDEARPISDLRASAPYRREMVRVLTRRTIKMAWERSRARQEL
jgi:CO/xanthine dehydrogenase FAD-binding subunit